MIATEAKPASNPQIEGACQHKSLEADFTGTKPRLFAPDAETVTEIETLLAIRCRTCGVQMTLTHSIDALEGPLLLRLSPEVPTAERLTNLPEPTPEAMRPRQPRRIRPGNALLALACSADRMGLLRQQIAEDTRCADREWLSRLRDFLERAVDFAPAPAGWEIAYRAAVRLAAPVLRQLTDDNRVELLEPAAIADELDDLVACIPRARREMEKPRWRPAISRDVALHQKLSPAAAASTWNVSTAEAMEILERKREAPSRVRTSVDARFAKPDDWESQLEPLRQLVERLA